MNYFLFHKGNLPKHIFTCLRNILKIDLSSKIFLCTDQKVKFYESQIEVIPLYDFNISKIDFLINDPNPLWHTSLLRIFYINEFLKQYKIPIIHYDNDILCYYNFDSIKDNYKNEIYITPHKKTEYTFGFCYINNLNKWNILTERIYNFISRGEIFAKNQTKDHIHEMRLLNFCGKDLLTDFCVYPPVEKDYIFDPSSYGQYLDGTPNGEQPGYIDQSHTVGSQLKKTDQIIFDKKPFLISENNTYPIFNLHIHSKNLEKYEIFCNSSNT
jgi:hypothetical protein